MTAFGFVILVMWAGVAYILWLGLRSQEGRAKRLELHQRVLRLAFASLFATFVAIPTITFIKQLTGTVDPPNNGLWPKGLYAWSIYTGLIATAFLFVLTPIVRAHETRVMRRDHRALGFPTPRSPWWPIPVAIIWFTVPIGLYVLASILIVGTQLAEAEATEAQLKNEQLLAQSDPSVQKLIRAGDSRSEIEAQIDSLTHASERSSQSRAKYEPRFYGYLIVSGLFLLGVFVISVIMYHRQSEKRRRYDLYISNSFSDNKSKD